MLLARNDAAIEQSRLYRQTAAPVSPGVDANGNALPQTHSGGSEDDSFGAQQILKAQERERAFSFTGGISVLYTDNVALTRRLIRGDFFAVGDVGVNWMPKFSRQLQGSFGARVAVFRYDRATDLDFTNLGFGAGLAYMPAALRGGTVFLRYDLTELLDRNGDETLTDHTFTVGIQKAVALGRSHGFAFGAAATLGLSDPSATQRSQLAAFLSYHLKLTRQLEADFLYRPAVHFYTDADRTDFNQVIALNLRLRLSEWAEVAASFSYGLNRSDRSVFDYNVGTTGIGAAVTVRF